MMMIYLTKMMNLIVNPTAARGDHGKYEHREECQVVSDSPSILSVFRRTVVRYVMTMNIRVTGIVVVFY